MPDLCGAIVYVAGAAHSNYGGMSTQRILDIKKFWLHYFKECNASNIEYGSSLLDYNY